MGKKTRKVLLSVALVLLAGGGGALLWSYTIELEGQAARQSWEEQERGLRAKFSLYREQIETIIKEFQRATTTVELHKSVEGLRADLRKSSLPLQVKQGLLIETASRILAQVPATFAEALEYRKVERDHPHLETLVTNMRGLRDLALPLFQEASALTSGSDKHDRKVKHLMAYTAGVVAAWLAEVEPDSEKSYDDWLLSFKAHIEALEEKPGDAWTQENLEIINLEVSRRYGGELDDPLTRQSRRSRVVAPPESRALPQKGRAAPGVEKGKM